MKTIKKLINALVLVLLMMSPFVLFAQPGGPGGDPDPNPGAPIDGGIALLLIAGFIYGVKILYDRRKDSSKTII